MNTDHPVIQSIRQTKSFTSGSVRQAGEVLLPDLERLLESEDAEVRRGVYSALAEMASPAALEIALKHIADPAPTARAYAISTSSYLLTQARYDRFLERLKIEPRPIIRGSLAFELANSRFISIEQRLRDLQVIRQWGEKGKFPPTTQTGNDLKFSLDSESEYMTLALAAVGDRQATVDLTNAIRSSEGQKRGELLEYFGYRETDKQEIASSVLRDLRRREFVPLFIELLDQTDAVQRLEVDAWAGRIPAYIRACDAAVMMLRTLLDIPLPYEFNNLFDLMDKGRNVIFTQAEIATFKEDVQKALAGAPAR